MILDIVTYRAVEISTDILQAIAGIKSSQGMLVKEIEAAIVSLFPKHPSLKVFVHPSIHDEGPMRPTSSVIGMEVMRTSMDAPVTPSAVLTSSDPIDNREIDRVDGALLFVLGQVGIMAEPSNIVWKACYVWRQEK